MPTSALAGIEASRPPAWTKSALLYILCGSLALYPLLEKFVAPVIAVSYAVAFFIVMSKLVANGLRVPGSYLGWVWMTYLVVYSVLYAIAVLYDNKLAYINQDSLGFLLYFGFVPILFLFIVF